MAAVDWLPRVSGFRSESELANLFGPLSELQAFGIWLVGDFRVRPDDVAPTYVLIALVVALGLFGLWWAWRRRAWELPTYLGVVGGRVGRRRPGQLALGRREGDRDGVAGLPRGRARGMRRAARARPSGRGGVAAVAIAAGVLWSNALAYNEVSLAPRGQLHELETIGRDFAGQGPR